MKVVYTAPNRGHHYKYANALNVAGCLHAFVSGFPRLSPRSEAPELNGKLYRADLLQTLYIMSLRGKLSTGISSRLAFLSKIEQDFACRRFMMKCDIFLFYSGSGLNSMIYGRKYGVVNIVEAVNSHVECQEDLLKKEHQDLHLPWKPFPNDEKGRRLREYEEADFVLLPSEFVKRSFIAKGFPEQKLLKVPYGFNSIANTSEIIEDNFKRKTFTILYVGSISVRKGIRYLVEAFKKLKHPYKKLVIVGPNAEDGALNGIGLTKDIVFTGVLKGTKLEDAYNSADVFCLPSIEEGLALVLGEAISFGLPIVTTTNTGAEDILSDGVEGYIVPIKDSNALCNQFQLLADNPDLLLTIRANCIAKSGTLNGWKETGEKLIQTLHNVMP